MLNVLFSWHAAVLAANQKYIAYLAEEPDLKVTLLVPPRWDESTSMVEAYVPISAQYDVRVDTVKKACKGISFRYRNIRDALNTVQPDVIFLYEEPYSYVAWQILYWKRKICPQARFIFYTWQNLDCPYSFWHRQAEKYVFRHSDLGVAGSRDCEDVLRLHGFQKPVRRVPLAIDPADFPPVDGQSVRAELGLRQFVIGYIGRLAYEKGLEDLLTALSLLTDLPWQLLLIGSGPDEASLRQLADRLGIRERIVWVSYVKNTEMYRYYPAMDVFVLPSRTTTAWKEQFGRVLIEAMSCGVPVIGSSSGEIPLVIADAGLVFPERDTRGLASVIRQLMEDESLRQNLAVRGKERVMAHFTWKKVAQLTAEIIRETVRGEK